MGIDKRDEKEREDHHAGPDGGMGPAGHAPPAQGAGGQDGHGPPAMGQDMHGGQQQHPTDLPSFLGPNEMGGKDGDKGGRPWGNQGQKGQGQGQSHGPKPIGKPQ